VNKTRQIGVGMTTNIGQGGRRGRREMNTREETETGPDTCQERLGSVVFDILWTKGSCTWRVKPSWAIVIASKRAKEVDGINRLRPCGADLASSSWLPCWIQQARHDRRLRRSPVWDSWGGDRVYVWAEDLQSPPQPFSWEACRVSSWVAPRRSPQHSKFRISCSLSPWDDPCRA